jgi:hypothetical protein
MSNADLATIDAMKLRELGEKADGGRDADLYLVQILKGANAGAVDVVEVGEVSQNPGRFQVLAKIPRMAHRVALAPLESVVLNARGKSYPCPKDIDALFWTDSSAEKFDFPYYAHMRIFPEDYVEKLKDDFRDSARRPRILAIAHRNPSRSSILRDGPDPVPFSPGGGTALYLAPSLSAGDEVPWMTPEVFRARFLESGSQ